MVRKPSGSTLRAISRASEFTMSALAGDTARMTQVECRMYSPIMARMRVSMSQGWSPTGTFARPGRSTRVIVLQRMVVSATMTMLATSLLQVLRVVCLSR